MADSDTPPTSETGPAKPVTRRRSTTPAKATPKPRPKKAATESPAPPVAAKPKKAPPKPRSTKRTAGAASRKPARKAGAAKATKPSGDGRWGMAAIAGGLAAAGAAGAAVAALFTLRSSSAKPDKVAKSGQDTPARSDGRTAHQPDGADSSESFQAGIADENTVPDA